MADIVAASVTFTEVPGTARRGGGPRSSVIRRFDLAFGDGALTYNSTTNVPLSRAALGLTTDILALKVFARTPGGNNTNYVWEWDKSVTSPALTGFEVRTGDAGPAGLTEIANGTAIAAQAIRIEVEGY